MQTRLRAAAFAVVAFAILAGCRSHQEHLVGPYSLSSIDVPEQMSVYYDLGDGSGIGRINATVYSVGWNSQYIVAKQHPSANRSITNYFYLDMSKDSKYAEPDNSVVGPLTEAEFMRKKQELALPDFTQTIRGLE
jgi:hypothetical protein